MFSGVLAQKSIRLRKLQKRITFPVLPAKRHDLQMKRFNLHHALYVTVHDHALLRTRGHDRFPGIFGISCFAVRICHRKVHQPSGRRQPCLDRIAAQFVCTPCHAHISTATHLAKLPCARVCGQLSTCEYAASGNAALIPHMRRPSMVQPWELEVAMTTGNGGDW